MKKQIFIGIQIEPLKRLPLHCELYFQKSIKNLIDKFRKSFEVSFPLFLPYSISFNSLLNKQLVKIFDQVEYHKLILKIQLDLNFNYKLKLYNREENKLVYENSFTFYQLFQDVGFFEQYPEYSHLKEQFKNIKNFKTDQQKIKQKLEKLSFEQFVEILSNLPGYHVGITKNTKEQIDKFNFEDISSFIGFYHNLEESIKDNHNIYFEEQYDNRYYYSIIQSKKDFYIQNQEYFIHCLKNSKYFEYLMKK